MRDTLDLLIVIEADPQEITINLQPGTVAQLLIDAAILNYPSGFAQLLDNGRSRGSGH